MCTKYTTHNLVVTSSKFSSDGCTLMASPVPRHWVYIHEVNAGDHTNCVVRKMLVASALCCCVYCAMCVCKEPPTLI